MNARIVGAGLVLLVLFSGVETHGQRLRESEYRSLNTMAHEINFQKNGYVDVLLADQTVVVDNAFPMIWFADENEPERLDIDGMFTQRFGVRDALGDGNGMLMRTMETEWSFRVYPTQPFFAVQVGYTNTGKKPETVRALLPWCLGDPKRGELNLGENTPEAAILIEALGDTPRLVRGDANTPEVLGVYNPASGQSFVAGFLSEGRADNQIVLTSAETDPVYDQFRAISTFDPPITVAPGETFFSEALYLSFAESEPYTAMRRYARAVTAANPTHPAQNAEPVTPERWSTPVLRPARGITSVVADIAQQAFAVPYLIRHTVRVPRNELGDGETLALVTAASLLGAKIEWEGEDTLTDRVWERLDEAVRPVASDPARPLDFFIEQRPRFFHLPVDRDGKEAHVLAVFNWSPARAESTTVPLSALGLPAEGYYTAYDFWSDRYLGIAQGALNFSVKPAGVTVLVLRPYVRRPMLLRLGSNLAQSEPDTVESVWRPVDRTYTAMIAGAPRQAVELPLLVPEGYAFVSISGADALRDNERGDVIRVSATLDETGHATVVARFETTR